LANRRLASGMTFQRVNHPFSIATALGKFIRYPTLTKTVAHFISATLRLELHSVSDVLRIRPAGIIRQTRAFSDQTSCLENTPTVQRHLVKRGTHPSDFPVISLGCLGCGRFGRQYLVLRSYKSPLGSVHNGQKLRWFHCQYFSVSLAGSCHFSIFGGEPSCRCLLRATASQWRQFEIRKWR